jgi:hypothetical protein
MTRRKKIKPTNDKRLMIVVGTIAAVMIAFFLYITV